MVLKNKVILGQSVISALLFFMIIACNTSDKNERASNNVGVTPDTTISNDTSVKDFEILFIGNSHSSLNNLPDIVGQLIETGVPEKKANTANAPGWGFLSDRINDSVTQKTIDERAWTHIILQAQKYSTTGQYSYPTTAAEEFIRRIKTKNATPILFPEWPRRGNFEEGMRVHLLHLSIAATEPACVAPIGLAWDLAIARHSNIKLHAQDGNHSNLKGALLAAYVFYETITTQKANELPYIESINVSAEEQKILREIASEIVAANPACPLIE